MYYTEKLDHGKTIGGGSSSLGDQGQVVRLRCCSLDFLAMHVTTNQFLLKLRDNYICDSCNTPS